MLHRKLLATLLAVALLLSVALPTLAAPAHEDGTSSSIVAVLFSWLSESLGMDLGSDRGIDSSPAARVDVSGEPAAKLGSAVDPMGIEDGSDPADGESPTAFSTENEDTPGDELGSFVDPMG